MRNRKTGSVLMEFVIVLPMYLILLGSVFMFGEMSLHGVHLASSGDRTVAVAMPAGSGAGDMGSGVGDTIAKAISPSRDMDNPDLEYREEGVEAKVSSFSVIKAGKVEDAGFKGSWSWLVASTLKDDYALTPWTRGMVKTWANLEKMVKMTQPPGSTGSDTVLSKLFGGTGLGRVSMTSKDLGSVNVYAYYTYIRNAKGRSSYRSWGNGALVDASGKNGTWYTCVADEGFAGEVGWNGLTGVTEGADGVSRGSRAAYVRDGTLKSWSE